MTSWSERQLGECAQFQEGYVNPSQKVGRYFDGPVKWLRAVDLNDSFVSSTSRTLSEEGFKSAGKSAKLFAPGTLAISKSGTIGRLGILKDYMCGNRAVINIIPDPSICHPLFIFFVLRHQRPKIETLADGSVQKNLYVPLLAKFRFKLPPLDVQCVIAEVLGSLDDKIELNRRMNETLEAMAQAIFRDWFVDFGPTRRKLEGVTDPVEIMGGLVTNAERARQLADLFPARQGDGGLPEGWKAGVLGDLAKSAGATVDPGAIDPEMPYIGLEHMPRKSIALAEWEAASKVTSTKARFEKGQILFGKLRPYFHKVGVAPINGVCSTDIVVLDGQSLADRPLVAALVSTEEFVAFTDQGSTGTKMPRTSWSNMKRYGVTLAPPALREAYGSVVAPLLDKIVCNIHETHALAATRDLLLPKLISGEIRLREAEEHLEAAQ